MPQPIEDAVKPATETEVHEALDALAQATPELIRLQKAAIHWLKALGPHANRYEWHELLNEAIVRTLAGSRRWNPRVDFVRHLSGTMRSIVSGWAKRGKREVLQGEQDGDPARDDAVETTLAADKDIALREAVLDIERRFADDPVATEVLAGWRMGMKGPEIQECGGISKKDFDAAVRRIRRTVEREEDLNGRAALDA